MTQGLVERLIPFLTSQDVKEFNVFSVMHHGTHEKQLSNIFAWLLDVNGSHRLGDRFVRAFLEEMNASPRIGAPVAFSDWVVRQEVNTASDGEAMDIADIVLESESTVIVVENYYISDGHGHGYSRYERFASREGKRPVVVMLCEAVDEALLASGWENAPVLSYPALLRRLMQSLDTLPDYALEQPDAYAFIRQMYRYFVKGTPMNSDHLHFVTALCATGEAERYRGKPELEAARFAADLHDLAHDRFVESRDALQRLKGILRNRVAPRLVSQLNALAQEPVLGDVNIGYSGIYQWTVNLRPARNPITVDGNSDGARGVLQIKFGPSAWFANERDKEWKRKVADPDYSRLFLTWNNGIHQSSVRLTEVADGLNDDDTRLLSEAATLLGLAP